ncbi:hypothetical protein OBBRIDRAFT_701500, partial [Obba rivulosa]
ELSRREYNRALDNLERLVVQRLFELTKAGMSGIGYKLREKIGKALKARAEAIKKALQEYNRRAAELKPPRAPLLWTAIIEMAALADFDLLREGRQDIRSLLWAQPAHRHAINLHFNIKRAQEKVERLNVEVRRLFTFLIDEHADFWHAIGGTLVTDPTLASELQARWHYQNQINEKIAYRLLEVSQLPGFSGKL